MPRGSGHGAGHPACADGEFQGAVAAGAVQLDHLEIGRAKCAEEDFGHIEFITVY